MLFFILFIVLIVVGAIVVYKSAEVHELHKMRAAFEDKRHKIQKLLENYSGNLEYTDEYYKGELQEIDEMESIIDEELNILKYFNSDSSN